ncbi:MAG TPA: branched-chain amino acid ABC transporter permease [Patescibacteria group bacterium]|nr:branched-chain amino acid ABC transporter permease [Patescibacteria group bacterium]
MLTGYQITLLNIAIFFGQFLITATALNFQYGNAGIPNMSNHLSVAVGAYTVSSIIFRISMWVVGSSGVQWVAGWVSGNPYNASRITIFMRTHPYLGISLYLLSIAMALLVGSLLGGFIAVISGKLRATYLMMFLYIIANAGRVIAANNEWIACGTLGSFVPNFLSWYPGENMLIIGLSTLLVGMSMYLIMRRMQQSPFGRLMRSVRENEWTVMSIGKNITKIRRDVMMFSSGIMSVTGVLMAFYYNFVQSNIYDATTYTVWPWLMITIGGTGNNLGTLVGVIVGVGLLKGFSTFNLVFGQLIASTGRAGQIMMYEDLLLATLLVLFLSRKPMGLVPEKQHYIPGINYKGIVLGKESEDS